MSEKLNCWEYHNCGREPGGIMADSLGVCPVTTAMRCDGDNSGRAGGRICWTIPTTEKSPSMKSCLDKACSECAFFRRVRFEEDTRKVPERKLTILTPALRPTEIA